MRYKSEKMEQVIEFLAPRMVGKRFENHSIPLELLKEFAVLESLVIEVAKLCYLQVHEDRKRVPKGFTDGVEIKLSGIGNGSAIPKFDLVMEQSGLLPSASLEYFEEARQRIIGAINAADYGEPINNYLPDNLLVYFDRIGRGLKDDEVIEFSPSEADRKARLTKGTRRALILASNQVEELTEEVILRGSIPEVDQERMSFAIQVINGHRISAPIESQYKQTIMDAFNGYNQGINVVLQGIGCYSRSDRLQSIESVEHISILDANDITARLEELKGLRQGWLNGKGIAPNKNALDWLAGVFQHNYSDDLDSPYLYPTAEGGVQVEWSAGDWEVTLEVNLEQRTGEWHALEMSSDDEVIRELNLDSSDDWTWISEEITRYMKSAR
jgi:hypothetical protein